MLAILVSLALLIVLTFRKINIVVVGIAAAAVITLLSGQPVVTAVTDTYMTGAAQFVRTTSCSSFSASCSERSWRRQGRLPPLPNSWLSCWGEVCHPGRHFLRRSAGLWRCHHSGGGVQPVSHCPLPVQEGQPAPLSAARRDCRRLLYLCLRKLSRHAQSGQCDPHHLSGDQHHGGPSGGRDHRNCCHAHGVCLLPVGGKSGPGPGTALWRTRPLPRAWSRRHPWCGCPARSSPSCPLCSS